MENKVKISGKDYVLKELKYKDLTGLGDIPKEDAAKKSIMLSVDMTDEEYDNLSLREGVTLQKAINELNGLDEDFQAPLSG